MEVKEQKKSKDEKEILGQSIFYSFALYARLFLNILRGIIVAKLLGPAIYGIRNAFTLVLEYESYSDLGTFAATNRQVPLYRGRNDQARANRMLASVFGLNMLYALVVGAVLILISIYMKVKLWDENYVNFFLFLGPLIITNKVKECYNTQLICDKEFHTLSRAEIIYGFSSSIFCVFLVYYFGLIGFLEGLLISDILFIGYLFKKIKKIEFFNISFSIFRKAVTIGFPMMITFLLLMVLSSADRVIIISMLDQVSLGQYGIATVATVIIGTIPRAVQSVTLPRITEKLGMTNDKHSIKNFLIEPSMLMAYFLPYLISVIYISAHLPIEYFLTKYLPAILIVKILSIGLFFDALANMPRSISFALNKQIQVIYFALAAVLLNISLNYGFIRAGWGVNGVAVGTGISYFTFSSSMMWYSLIQFKTSTKEVLQTLSALYSPIIYTIILLFAIDTIFQSTSLNFWDDFITAIRKILIFITLYSGIFFFVRKTSIFKKIFDYFPQLKFLNKLH